MFDVGLLIEGQSRPAAGGRTFERRDPVTGDVAMRAAAAAFPSWSARGPNARRALLLKAAHALQSRASDFVGRMAVEIGATPAWAGGSSRHASC